MAEAGEKLPRPLRMRQRPEFERAYASGIRLKGALLTLILVPNDRPHARLGVAASKKLGKAVQRNRAKRLVREVFRRHKIGDAVDVVVVPRRELLDVPFARVEADFLAALGRRVRGAQSARTRPGGRHAGGAETL